MTIFQMLEQSVSLTLLGMGIVFLFLIIMVLCVSIMGKVVRTLGADKDPAVPAAGASPASNKAKTTAVAAAITAAVNEYQKDNS